MPLTLRKLTFHNDSRKPFAEEAPVIAAVERARELAGLVHGAALFKATSNISAAPTVIPRAVDIIRDGMGTAMEQALAKGYAQGIVETTFEKPSRRSGTAQAIQDVSDSLQRLGVSG